MVIVIGCHGEAINVWIVLCVQLLIISRLLIVDVRFLHSSFKDVMLKFKMQIRNLLHTEVR